MKITLKLVAIALFVSSSLVSCKQQDPFDQYIDHMESTVEKLEKMDFEKMTPADDVVLKKEMEKEAAEITALQDTIRAQNLKPTEEQEKEMAALQERGQKAAMKMFEAQMKKMQEQQ